MKNLLVIFLMTFVLVSCEGPVGPEGPMGPGSETQVINFTVKQADWQLIDDGQGLNRSFTYTFDAREITKAICEDGTVVGFLYQKIGNTTVQTSLSCSIPFEDPTGHTWTETYSFDFEPGYITFNIMYSDFNVDQKPTTQDFRIVLSKQRY